MPTQNDLIDIILPVSGDYSLTKQCINSILKNTSEPFKLIIVDNGIKEPELLSYLTDLKQENDFIRLVAKDNTTGTVSGVNKGFDVSSSSLVAILNNAVVVSKNWLGKLKSGLDAHENAAIIAPLCNNRFIPNIDVRFDLNKNIELQLEEYNKFLEQSPVNPNDPKSLPYMAVPYVLGYCMLLKREVIETCGGFDPIYGDSLYFSDFDLCFRAARKGYKMFVSNKTAIYRDNSDLQDVNHPKVRLPVNYTIFSMKWKNHEFFKYIPANMFPKTLAEFLQKDEKGFYFNEKLKQDAKKYLLIHPSIVDVGNRWRPPYVVSPSGLLRVANYLINDGNKVNYYDFEPYNYDLPHQSIDLVAKAELHVLGRSLNEFGQYMKQLGAVDEVFITLTMTYHYPHLAQMIARIKEVYGDIKITVGGIYATLCPEEVKELGVEVHSGPYFNADGLRPLVEITSETDSAVMRVIKGCPRTCSYCVVPGLEGRKVTHYEKENIIRHFHEYYAMGFTNYLFWDSNLLFGRDNLFVLLDYLVQYGYNETITFDFSYGLEFALIDDTFIEKLSKFKLTNDLFVPLESAEYDLYKDRFHRPSGHLGVITEAVKKLQNAKFKHMVFYVMAGLPNQTLDQILKTLIFGWRLGLSPHIMLYCPIPGSEEFSTYLEFYKDKKNWELNPYLFPCESNELTMETMLYLESFNFIKLAYTEEEGFFLQRVIPDKKTKGMHIIKVKFEDQNPIMTRLKELITSEEVRADEVDDRTLRFLHAITL
jgi:GT2 family glycosyltransferase